VVDGVGGVAEIGLARAFADGRARPLRYAIQLDYGEATSTLCWGTLSLRPGPVWPSGLGALTDGGLALSDLDTPLEA
jgi:hypothetical protein